MITENSLKINPLGRLTHTLAIIMLALIPLQVVVYVVAPPPDSVEGFFMLFEQSWLLGLLSLDLLYILNNMILIIIYLCIFTLLRPEYPSHAWIGLAVGLTGIASYFPSNPAIEMLSLSHSYIQSAAIGQQRYLAAGEALLAGYTGTAFDVYYVLNAIALLVFAIAIRKSPQFSKSAGNWGIAAAILMIIPSNAGTIGLVFSLLSLIPWIVFILLLLKPFQKLSFGS